MKLCHACGGDLGNPERVGRGAACLRCGADLHCCLNCRFYAPGAHNDCSETQAERVVEKARGNFCDYFSLRDGPLHGGRTDAHSRAQAGLDALFRKKQ